MKPPFFSVIIPLFNKEDYVFNTIKSVLNQTFTDFEIIVVNDGSTDSSYKIASEINDPRIRLYSNNNKGLSYSRNYGVKKANAHFIAFLDADDLWTNNYLKCIKSFIEKHKNEMAFATNNYTWFHKKSPNLNAPTTKRQEPQLIENYFSFGKNIFSYSSIVLHKSVFEDVGFFNETFNHGEEEDFTIRCFLKYNLVYTSEPKVFYLKNVKNQLTAPNKNRKRILPDYETYTINNSNKSLKKYVDFIHFKLLVLFKMEKNDALVNFYKQKINTSNLSLIKKIKYHLPTNMFYYTKSVYIWFSKTFIHS